MLEQSDIPNILYSDPVIGEILRYQFSDYFDLLNG